MLEILTAAGTLVAQGYEEGDFKGIRISKEVLGGADELICLIDVTSDGEIRIIPYKEYEDEPFDIFSYNGNI